MPDQRLLTYVINFLPECGLAESFPSTCHTFHSCRGGCYRNNSNPFNFSLGSSLTPLLWPTFIRTQLLAILRLRGTVTCEIFVIMVLVLFLQVSFHISFDGDCKTKPALKETCLIFNDCITSLPG